MSEQQTRACGTCKGDGGRTITTTTNGVTRATWQSCKPCYGTGVQGGGV